MRMLVHSLAVCLVVSVVSVASAQQCKEGKCASKSTSIATVQDENCEDGKCPIETAMGKLPKMQYKVGEKTTCCPDSAASLAKKSDSAVTYIVAKKEFKSKEKAYGHLVNTTEKYVKNFATPCKCEVSKKTTIAGKACDCPVEAADRAKLVATAMKKVKMSYQVGDKNCSCPNEAASLETSTGSKKEFVVGKTKTCCEMTARLKLAQAKYKAAVQALAKAETKTEKK